VGDRRRRGLIGLQCGNGSPVFYARRLVASRKTVLRREAKKTASCRKCKARPLTS